MAGDLSTILAGMQNRGRYPQVKPKVKKRFVKKKKVKLIRKKARKRAKHK